MPTKALRVGHLNVRSLTAHLDEVVDLLAAKQLDVLCLSESWLTDGVDSRMLRFPGYTIHRKDRASSRVGGGVAILSRRSISVLPLQVPGTGSSLETLWLQSNQQPTFILGVGYRPPSGPPAAAIEDLHYQLTDVLSRDRPMYLLGDLNFDTLQPTKPGVSGYLQLLADLSLHQLVTSPTRPGATPSLIDHIIVNRPELTASTSVVRCDISDHDLVTTNITNIRIRHKPEIIRIRPTRGVDQNALCLQLLLADWTQIDGSETVAGKWDAFLDVWTPIINLHMPIKEIKTRSRQYPWLRDDEVRQAMADRDRARARRDRHNSESAQQDYRDSRNAVKSALHRASSAYYLTSFKNSRKKTWRDIRNFLVASKKAEPRTNVSTADPGWADRVNKFFADVGPAVAETLSAADDGAPLPPRPPRVCSGAFRPRPVTMPELSAALARMGTSRACGEDDITVQMLRMTFPVIAPQLLKIINCSISTSELPAQWKQATVLPLFKKGDAGDPNNYRPISILPTVAKLCERVICSQLISYLSEQHVLCPEQYGFRPGLSTEAAMLDAVTFVTNCVDSGHVAPLVAIDTSKAFDSVEHARLLDKLGWYGVEPDWFAAWLSDRHQVVRGGTNLPEPVTHGVIQGSILGPALFLIFTNDLTQHLIGTKTIMYADDTQFFDSDSPKNITSLKVRIQNTLSTAQNWFTRNRLKINPSKTEMIIFQSKRITQSPDSSFSISFGTDIINPSQSAKVLGVVVDRHLSWHDHVSSVVQKCYCILIGIARAHRRIPQCVKQLLIEALVFPHIRYCLSVWAGCGVGERRRVQKVINFAARVVTGLGRRDHVTPALAELGWPSVDGLIAESDVAAMRRILHAPHAPELLRSKVMYRSDVSCRQSRATADGQLQIPRTRTELARRSFLSRAVRTWNEALEKCRTVMH